MTPTLLSRAYMWQNLRVFLPKRKFNVLLVPCDKYFIVFDLCKQIRYVNKYNIHAYMLIYTTFFSHHFNFLCLLTSCPCNFSLYFFAVNGELAED